MFLFNKVLNLFSEKYSHQITREFAEKQNIKTSEIYQNNVDNTKLINEFIKLYNNFKLEDNGKKIELNVDKNCLCDFFLDDNNKYGKTYKKIYKKFIDKQNKGLEKLLDIKINNGVFDSNCKNKINIQQIKEDEIFTFNIPKKFNFIEVIFNSSYRKVIDTQKYENYNEFEINLDSIETKMTDLLLKNKKLLNNELIEFSYNNEVFSNEIKDLILILNMVI